MLGLNHFPTKPIIKTCMVNICFSCLHCKNNAATQANLPLVSVETHIVVKIIRYGLTHCVWNKLCIKAPIRLKFWQRAGNPLGLWSDVSSTINSSENTASGNWRMKMIFLVLLILNDQTRSFLIYQCQLSIIHLHHASIRTQQRDTEDTELCGLTHRPLGDFNDIFDIWMTIFFKFDCWGISNRIALRWMTLGLTDAKSTLAQVMARCHQATSHYLIQCWPRSRLPYGVTRPQCVNLTKGWPVHCQCHSAHIGGKDIQCCFAVSVLAHR